MKSDKLMDAMNEIDDKYIMQAHEPLQQNSKVKMYWKPVVISVLCTCAVFAIVPAVLFNFNSFEDYGATKMAYEYDAEEPIMNYEMNEAAEESMAQNNVENSKKVTKEHSVHEEKRIVTASLDIQTLDLDTITKKIEEETNKVEGYIQYSNMYTGYQNNRIYSATIRIPSDAFDAFVESMKKTGDVTNYSQSIDDVTESYYDVQSHIDSLKAEKERVTEFYQKAQTVEELTLVEQRLSEIEYELNSYEAQLKNYDTLTNYSTLNISVTETKVYTEQKDDFLSRLSNTFTSGWSGFVSTVEGLILAIVYNIWTILVLTLIGFGAYKGYRHWKK